MMYSVNLVVALQWMEEKLSLWLKLLAIRNIEKQLGSVSFYATFSKQLDLME